MTDSNSLTPVDDKDYSAIENAVMETARGRWFLAEYARRHRSADTEMLLDAIHKLETNLTRGREVPNIDTFKLDIADMANAIERTKKEIAQIADKGDHGDRFSVASNELDAIVQHTESATQEILNTAEQIQEICFEMREAGVDEKVCDQIEEFTTNIYMACSFQDLTGQRTQKVVHVLRYLETRVHAMIDIWHSSTEEIGEVESTPIYEGDTRPDAELLNGPQMEGMGVDQNEVDDMFSNDSTGDHDADEPTPDPDAEVAVVEADPAESGDQAASAIEDDLEFATAAEMEDDPDVIEEGVEAEPLSTSDDLAEEAADVFAASDEEAAPADDEPAAVDKADTDFEGADVFEVADSEADFSDPSDEVELTMDDIVEGWSEKDLETDPTLELSEAERLALLH